jgi:hypothetical protein
MLHDFPLVPKLYLGTKMVAKLSLASKGVPKPSLGTRKTSLLRLVDQVDYKLNRLINRDHKFM